MKNLLLISLSIFILSCKTSKTITTIVQDSTEVKVKIDTSFVIVQDTTKFDSLLASHLLLEERIDSLESLPEPQDKILKDKRSEVLYKLYKKKYNSLVELRQGAKKDTTYSIERKVKISSKDTIYYQPFVFKISIIGDSLGFEFNQDLKVLSTKTTSITKINRKIGLFTWLKSKYTIYSLILFAILLIILRIIKR